mmetsp:Transcript_50090/g.119174  ORF Transcript_50090/g.119174 Transcript_50090/m.119174 type:complete len:318 (+) Transcript_50090:61-1014(+)
MRSPAFVAVTVLVLGAWIVPPRTFVSEASASPRLARRQALLALQAAAPAAAEAAADGRPVVAVLGAGGRTGNLIPGQLLKLGARPRALTRSGKWTPPAGETAEGIETGKADVTDAASLAAALAGCTAVVWAAAFSRGNSTPKEVDNAGLVSTAKAVRDLGVQRLVVVSSAATTRPYAPVGVLLNTVADSVLLEKLQGESEMKGILSGSSSTYTIIRPGGLKLGDAKGFKDLEFNQADTHVGPVQRADVAAVAAACAMDPQNRGAMKTFEMYEADGRSGLLPWFGEPKFAVRGEDCGEMLGQLRPDGEVPEVKPLPFL